MTDDHEHQWEPTNGRFECTDPTCDAVDFGVEPREKATVHERLSAAFRDIAPCKTGSPNVTYKFRSIDDVVNHLHAVLAKHGLYAAPKVHDDWKIERTTYKEKLVTCAYFRVSVMITAPDGSTVELGPGLAQSHDYGDKAAYQAQQNAFKYVLLEAFLVPTEGLVEDMDARRVEDTESADDIRAAVHAEYAEAEAANADKATKLTKRLVFDMAGKDADLAERVYARAVASVGGTPDAPVDSDAKRLRVLAAAHDMITAAQNADTHPAPAAPTPAADTPEPAVPAAPTAPDDDSPSLRAVFAEFDGRAVLAAARRISEAPLPSKLEEVWQRVDSDVDFGAKLFTAVQEATSE